MRSYIEALERAVEQIEDSSHAPARKRQRTGSKNPAARVPDYARRQLTSSPTADAASQAPGFPNVDSAIRNTMGEIELLSWSAMAEPRNKSEKLTQNLSLTHVVRAALDLDGSDPSKGRVLNVSVFHPKLMVDQAISLRSAPVAAHLTRFVEEVCIFYPFLDGTAFRSKYNHLLELLRDHDRVPEDAVLSYIKICLGLAIGASMAPPSPGSSSLISTLHSSAIQQLDDLNDIAPMEIVHCLLLFCIFATLSPSGGSAWHLIGLTMKSCVSLGLHKEPGDHLQLESSEIDERANLFWSAYFLDR